MGQAQIKRGLKWTGITAFATANNDSKTLTWLLSQTAIQEDIKAYQESIKVIKPVVKK